MKKLSNFAVLIILLVALISLCSCSKDDLSEYDDLEICQTSSNDPQGDDEPISSGGSTD